MKWYAVLYMEVITSEISSYHTWFLPLFNIEFTKTSFCFIHLANINECASTPCANGVCNDGVNSYTCQCNQGFSGTNCQGQLQLIYSPQWNIRHVLPNKYSEVVIGEVVQFFLVWGCYHISLSLHQKDKLAVLRIKLFNNFDIFRKLKLCQTHLTTCWLEYLVIQKYLPIAKSICYPWGFS